MGSTVSSTHTHGITNDFNKSNYQQQQQTLQRKNILIENLTKENEFLKAKMEKNAHFHMALETIHGELFEFKENMDKVKENIKTGEAQKEIARLKQENAGLFAKLRSFNPNYNAGLGKMNDLSLFEADMAVEKHKLGNKLDDLKEIMDEATSRFVDAIEKAHKDMKTVLGGCKKKLKVIEELQKNHENSIEMEKIKNILLQQNNVFIKDLMVKAPSLLNTIQKPMTEEPKSNITAHLNPSQIDNLNISIHQKEPIKDLNISESDSEKETDDDLKILIFYAEETEEDDDEDKARLILKKLTNKNLNNIKANRMGKKGNHPRPIIVTLDKKETLNDIMKKRYSLKETEFKGLKIVKFKKDHKKASDNTTTNTKTDLTKKSKAADLTNPLLSNESDCKEVEEKNEDQDEELPFKIVLHYVPESDNDYDRVVKILRVLTNRPLRNVGYRRLGLKPKNHIRPIVVSFEEEEYVDDCLNNRLLLKDNGFPKIRVCHYRDHLKSNIVV